MSNEFYTPSGTPANSSQGSSAAIRAELALVEDGFDKLPVMTGNDGEIVAVNSGGSALEAITTTGTGSGVRATSPTLVTPILGTPTSGNLSNCTALPISTGVSGLAANVATFLATPSSANLRAALTDESGTGVAYFQGGDLGTPSAGVATNLTGLPLTTGVTGTLAVTNGGTGRTTSTTAYGLLAAGTTATGAHQTLAAGATTEILVGGGAAALPVWTTASGSGAPVRATSPTLTTPTINTAASVGGSWTAAATWTLPAFTLGGTVTLNGQTFSGAAVFSAGATFGGAITGITDLTTTGNTILGNAQADTLNVGNGDIIKDASGNTGFGVTPQVKFQVKQALNVNFGIEGKVVGPVGAVCLGAFNDAHGANIPMELRATEFAFTGPSSDVTISTAGVVTATSFNKVTLTAPAAGSTLTIANGKTLTANSSLTLAGTDGKTLTVSNSLTLAGTDGKTLTASNSLTLAGTDGKTLTVSKSLTLDGTDGTTMTFPSTSASIARTDAAQTFTGNQTVSGQILPSASIDSLTNPPYAFSGQVNFGMGLSTFGLNQGIQFVCGGASQVSIHEIGSNRAALATRSSDTTGASFRIPHGTAPSSPQNGDMWTTTAGLFVRINGSTVGPLS